MKTFLYILLSSAALLAAATICFAYSTWSNGVQGGCGTCHPEGPAASAEPPQLHGIDAHAANCTNCHSGTPAEENVVPSACLQCHPIQGTNGLCPLVTAPAHASIRASCEVCHDSCIPASATTTTTQTDNGTSTTTMAQASTTTTAFIAVSPDQISVDGALDQTVAVTVTLTRSDISGLTTQDLEKLEISVGEACSDILIINPESLSYEVGDGTARITLTLTVAGDAPSSACMIRVADPEGIANPPLDSSVVFTVTSTLECQIQSISPDAVRVGFGLLPRIRMFTITASRDLQEAGVGQEDLSFAKLNNAMVLRAEVSGDQIRALVLFWGTRPGIYAVELGPCGSIPIEVLRFF